ncbi:MAG: hypothetical protein O3B17_06670, partial [Actinomycetota bacterium]|nr:hypothetical protein [Actinomycetota bacterium]
FYDLVHLSNTKLRCGIRLSQAYDSDDCGSDCVDFTDDYSTDGVWILFGIRFSDRRSNHDT